MTGIRYKNEASRAFWAKHVEAWRRSTLSQRAYCIMKGISRRSFNRWYGQFKYEQQIEERKALSRRGPRNKPRTIPRTEEPPVETAEKSAAEGRRRRFSDEEKMRLVAEACRPGSSVSAVARRYGIATTLLFRWRSQFGLGASKPADFAPVRIVEETAPPTSLPVPLAGHILPPAVVVAEPARGMIEVELRGGRRLRFDADVEPDRVRRLIAALEGGAP